MGKVFMSRTEKSVMEKKLVGAHIAKEDAHRIAMLSLERNVPRSAILLEVINDYLKEQLPLSDMIYMAVSRAETAWNEKTNKSKNALELFCKEMESDLASHRIEKEISDQIIVGLRKSL